MRGSFVGTEWGANVTGANSKCILTLGVQSAHDAGMELASQFERFLGNISVDQPKLNRIKSAHSKLRRALESDGYVNPALLDTFLQGSYVHGTAIRPLGESADYDVDVCCLLDLSRVPIQTDEPKPLVRWLARRIKRMEAYRGKVSTRTRCVHIDFPGEFHMDVVPLIEASSPGNTVFPNASLLEVVLLAGNGRRNNGNLLVPNLVANCWEATNPNGLKEWYRNQNHRTSGRFTRVARMLKHWRNQAFDVHIRPPSVGFEVMLANSWPLYVNSDASSVSAVLRQMSASLSFIWPTATNPSLPSENLLRDWSRNNYEVFLTEVRASADLAEQALRETDEERSITLWQRLFRTRLPQRGH